MFYRVLIFIFLLLSIIIENAHAKNSTLLGIKAGINFSTLTGEDATIYNHKFGFCGGAFLAYPVSNTISLQVESLFSAKGANFGSTLARVTGSSKINYLEFPVLFIYSLNLQENVKAGLLFGPSFAFKLDGKTEIQYQEDSQEADLPKLRAYDLGINIGFNARQKNIVLNLRYNWGLLSIDSSPQKLEIRNRVISIALGYIFL